MRNVEMPYFMENDEWYYYDEKEEIYKLTSKAPVEAIISYTLFYRDDEEEDEIYE